MCKGLTKERIYDTILAEVKKKMTIEEGFKKFWRDHRGAAQVKSILVIIAIVAAIAGGYMYFTGEPEETAVPEAIPTPTLTPSPTPVVPTPIPTPTEWHESGYQLDNTTELIIQWELGKIKLVRTEENDKAVKVFTPSKAKRQSLLQYKAKLALINWDTKTSKFYVFESEDGVAANMPEVSDKGEIPLFLLT